MKSKIYLAVVMVIFAFSIAGCSNSKVEENVKDGNITRITEENSGNITTTAEVSKDETKKEEKTVAFKADKTVSFELSDESDLAIAKELKEKFGKKTVSKGDVIDLSEYCDWSSFSPDFRAGILNGIGSSFELNFEHSQKDPSFTFNVYDQAELSFDIKVNSLKQNVLMFYAVKK